MSKLKPQYLVSTDSIGFLGKPEQFIYLWKEYFENHTLDGVEIVAFKPIQRLKKIIDVFRKNNITPLSFHGRTGGENLLPIGSMITMTVINGFIEDADKLLKYFPEIEFLSHSPYLADDYVKKIIVQRQPKKMWIENHLYGKQGVENAIGQINIYRENKINTSGMFDVYHYLAHSIDQMQTGWTDMVEEINSYINMNDKNGQQFFSGIHFPIGTRLGDSLPIDNMTNEMLELFAEKIIPNIERVVFENQQNFPGLLFSTNKMLAKQKIRNDEMISRFKKTGIIY